MAYDKQAARESFIEVAETCPAVDEALAIAADKIKEQTGLLRTALTSWIRRALDAEESLEDAKARICDLERLVSELES